MRKLSRFPRRISKSFHKVGSVRRKAIVDVTYRPAEILRKEIGELLAILEDKYLFRSLGSQKDSIHQLVNDMHYVVTGYMSGNGDRMLQKVRDNCNGFRSPLLDVISVVINVGPVAATIHFPLKHGKITYNVAPRM